MKTKKKKESERFSPLLLPISVGDALRGALAVPPPDKKKAQKPTTTKKKKHK